MASRRRASRALPYKQTDQGQWHDALSSEDLARSLRDIEHAGMEGSLRARRPSESGPPLGLWAHQEADGGGKDPDEQKSASGREATKNRPEGACRHASKRKQHRGGEEHRGRKNENANRQPCLALSHTTRLCCTAASI